MQASAIDAGELFRRHAGFVARFVVRLGVAASDVDDLVQEVFLTAHRQGGFEARSARATTWLAAIAVRTVSNHRRSVRRRRVAPDEEQVAATAGREDPGASAEARESLRRVQQALETLDLDHRAAFVLYELEGQSCDAIAEALSIPKGTVYSRLHKARRKFLQEHQRMGAAADRPRGELR